MPGRVVVERLDERVKLFPTATEHLFRTPQMNLAFTRGVPLLVQGCGRR